MTDATTLRNAGEPTRDDMLTLIAGQLQWWLDYNQRGFPEGTALSANVHVIPPCWPTRGQLAAWISILTDAPTNIAAGKG